MQILYIPAVYCTVLRNLPTARELACTNQCTNLFLTVIKCKLKASKSEEQVAERSESAPRSALETMKSG
jgi:hypothetical protein